MTEQQFYKQVKKLLSEKPLRVKQLINETNSIANNIKIGQTAFMRKHAVSSETEYKQRCIKEKKIMYHAHIGMGSWSATEEALIEIDRQLSPTAFSPDRAGICLDRRMSLPPSYRNHTPAETGPELKTINDWNNLGAIAAIQPHMGDFMIGFPASLENTVYALRAGVTTIGNLSQFFAHAAPGWKDIQHTTAETIKALTLLARLREKGVLVHSYLEDGYGALFLDCTTVAAWAYLEKYIIEDLIGAKLAHCIGGLTSDPIKRAGWVFALDKIHNGDCIGSMFYGDTISFTQDFDENRGLISEYLLWDIMAQLKCPTGHAVHPLPVTESIRIPSSDEIIAAHKLGRRIEQTARKMVNHIDFSASEEFAQIIVTHGKTVFDNILLGLKDAGADIKDPAQLLFLLKKLGPELIEETFGAGKYNEAYFHKRTPIIPTDIYQMSLNEIEANRAYFNKQENKKLVRTKKIIVASSDVHEHGVMVIAQLLSEAEAQVIYLGAEQSPIDIVNAVKSNNTDAILISTHNGMALSYAEKLKQELDKNNITIPILMGGVLNQKLENQVLPVDISNELRKLGINVAKRLTSDITGLLEGKHHDK